MSTRAEDRPGRSHVPPTPPAKLAPADDPAWAHTLALAALAREARPTTTKFHTPGSMGDVVLGEPTLRGSDVEWAQQFRPDQNREQS